MQAAVRWARRTFVSDGEPPATTATATAAMRPVEVDLLRHDLNEPRKFPSNAMRTSRYTLLSFFPLSLLFQFRKVSNVYFLFVMILSLIPGSSPINPMSSVVPLAVVLLAAMLKDWWEDWKRHASDRRANGVKVLVLRGADFVPVESRYVRTGDVVLLKLGEEVRADCVVLNTSLPEGLTYIETANLDGETNAKTRRAKTETVARMGTVEDLLGACLPDDAQRSHFIQKGSLQRAARPPPGSPGEGGAATPTKESGTSSHPEQHASEPFAEVSETSPCTTATRTSRGGGAELPRGEAAPPLLPCPLAPPSPSPPPGLLHRHAGTQRHVRASTVGGDLVALGEEGRWLPGRYADPARLGLAREGGGGQALGYGDFVTVVGAEAWRPPALSPQRLHQRGATYDYAATFATASAVDSTDALRLQLNHEAILVPEMQAMSRHYALRHSRTTSAVDLAGSHGLRVDAAAVGVKGPADPGASTPENGGAGDHLIGAEPVPVAPEGVVVLGSAPCPDLSSWFGQLRFADGEVVPLGIEQFLPRGCIIRNTDWVMCAVVYTGKHTKMMLNMRQKPLKTTRMGQRLNLLNLSLFAIMQSLILLLCGLAVWWRNKQLRKVPGHRSGHTAWYIQWSLEQYSGARLFWWRYLTNFVLLSFLIPLSLYVTLEFNKAMQMVIIMNDRRMSIFDEYTGKRKYSRPKTSELNCQLAHVQYIFTDKTGTLTENLMTFVGGFVAGTRYEERENPGGLGKAFLKLVMASRARVVDEAGRSIPPHFRGPTNDLSGRFDSTWGEIPYLTAEASLGSGLWTHARHRSHGGGRFPSRGRSLELGVGPWGCGGAHDERNRDEAAAAWGGPSAGPVQARRGLKYHLFNEEELATSPLYKYLLAIALCHSVVCFDKPTATDDGHDHDDDDDGGGDDDDDDAMARSNSGRAPKTRDATAAAAAAATDHLRSTAPTPHVDSTPPSHRRIPSEGAPAPFHSRGMSGGHLRHLSMSVGGPHPDGMASASVRLHGRTGSSGWLMHRAIQHHRTPTLHTVGNTADLIDDEKIYEGQSLDEIALVSAVRSNLFTLHSRTAKKMYVRVLGRILCYSIIAELEFTPQRKLMSILLRRDKSGDLSAWAEDAQQKRGRSASRHDATPTPATREASVRYSLPPLGSPPSRSGNFGEWCASAPLADGGGGWMRPNATHEPMYHAGWHDPSHAARPLAMSSSASTSTSGDVTEAGTDEVASSICVVTPRAPAAASDGAGMARLGEVVLMAAPARREQEISPEAKKPTGDRSRERQTTTMAMEDVHVTGVASLPGPVRRKTLPPLLAVGAAATGRGEMLGQEVVSPHPTHGGEPPPYLLLTKGADTSMLDIMNRANPRNLEMKDAMLEELATMARKGFRTLVYGQRHVCEREVLEWMPTFLAAQCHMTDRSGKLHEAYALLERDIDLLGTTAVEDKLQDGVPETLAFFLEANIVVWMLTGDKRETAVTIAETSGIVDQRYANSMVHLDVSHLELPPGGGGGGGEQEHEEAAAVDAARTTIAAQLDAAERACDASDAQHGVRTVVIVVDGKTLSLLFRYEDLQRRFFDVGCRCRSAVCCRMTPLQKAQIVRLFQKNTKAVALAIGDGANDVSMIQESKIGVGIMGLEGSQAELASDYAIPKFRFLKRLLVVHGRHSLYGDAHCILFSIYKNVLLTCGMMTYSFYTGFSGQVFVDSWLLSMLSFFFCSIQPMLLGVVDKDVEDELAESLPGLYTPIAVEHMFFNVPYIAKWLGCGVVEGAVLFFFIIYAVAYGDDMYPYRSAAVEDYGTLFFILFVLVADIRVAGTITTYTLLVTMLILLSFGAIPWFTLLYSQLNNLVGSTWMVFVTKELMRTAKFWLFVVFAVGLYVVFSLTVDLYIELFYPWCNGKPATLAARATPHLRRPRRHGEFVREYILCCCGGVPYEEPWGGGDGGSDDDDDDGDDGGTGHAQPWIQSTPSPGRLS